MVVGIPTSWVSQGDSEDESPLLNCEMPELQEGVEAVYGNRSAFVAIKQGGQALAWGAPRQGGEIPESIAHHLQSGVKSISQTNEAFCALKENGDVYAWGQPNFGGEIPSGLHEKLKDVISVSGTFNLHGGAFAALTSAGAVMTWGLDAVGGDSSAVAEQLQSGVCSVICGGCAFAALKEGGTVVTWGDPHRGGKKEVTWADDESEDEEEECSDDGEGSESEEKHDPYSVEDQLSSGVKSIIGSDDVFAALKETGEVVTWGMAVDGAHQSDELKEQLKSGVESISATYTNFSALKNDGGLVIWGVIDDYGTGRSLESLQEQLESGVLGVTALPKPNLWGQFVHKASGEVIPVGFVGHLPDVVEEELKSGVEEVTGNSSGYVVLKRTS
ncbi:unnamed protein product [Durusdinium trenchii]|uniref:Uncharacterized protein n=1 Tax=Durusdinium trenchii TaxID=1381693 RepID=A0ABP0RWZ2_9DINO